MRNLDAVNLAFMRPSKVATWAPFLPIFAGTFGWLMASETSPGPLAENPLAILSCAILVFACFAILMPAYFIGIGVPSILVRLSSISLVCLY